MPNWVSINMTVKSRTPEEMKKFRDEVSLKVGDEIRSFSFGKIVPMPSVLEGTTKGSHSGIGYDAFYGDPTNVLNYPWVKSEGVTTVEELRDFLDKRDSRYRSEADQAKKAEDETGFTDWYGWSVKNWGTKWDASSIDICASEDCLFEIRFDTAWDLPTPILHELARKYPELEFSGGFIEEDDSFEGDFESDFSSEEMEVNSYPVVRDEDEDEEDEGDGKNESKSLDLGEIQQNHWF